MVIDDIAVDFYPDVYAPVTIFGIVVGFVVGWTESRGQITCAVAVDPAWVLDRMLLPGECIDCGFIDAGDHLDRGPRSNTYPCPACLEPGLAAELAHG